VACANGVVEVGAATWFHGFFGSFDISGKDWTERDFPGRFGVGGETAGAANAAGEASFDALLLNATGATGAIVAAGISKGAWRGLCGCGDRVADEAGTGLADEGAGIIGGTGASVF
jgi:hypothetical protein